MARLDRERLGPYLLGLMGPRHSEFDYGDLSDIDWHDLDRLAAEYRLQPLLHARTKRGECAIRPPDAVIAAWRTAHRDSALLALAQRTELFGAVERLREHGIAALALKGAWLAWYAYPAAAERPMRDIDLLLPGRQVLQAWDLLCERSFMQSDASARPAAEMVGSEKHLPPITSPGGVEFELHQFLWERGEAMEWHMPPFAARPVWDDAVVGEAGDPARYPAAHHTLVHLIVHAAHSHRFDVGPLLLSDIDHVLAKLDIDWDEFWRRAHEDRFARGAVLVFALVDRWRRPGLLQECHCPLDTPVTAVDDAQALLLQDYRLRKDAALGSSLFSLGATALARLKGADRPRHTAEDGGRNESFGHGLLRRGREAAASFAKRDIRRTARRHARLGKWLSDGER